MLAAQASGAQIQSLLLAIYGDNCRVNVRHPAAVGMALGMADIMAKLR